jgi:hypothetical protein
MQISSSIVEFARGRKKDPFMSKGVRRLRGKIKQLQSAARLGRKVEVIAESK